MHDTFLAVWTILNDGGQWIAIALLALERLAAHRRHKALMRDLVIKGAR